MLHESSRPGTLVTRPAAVSMRRSLGHHAQLSAPYTFLKTCAATQLDHGLDCLCLRNDQN